MPEDTLTPPPATPATPAPPAPAAGPVQLPDDHPLVKAFQTQKAELADARKRLTDIDDAQKTEAQKLADRIAALEKENTTLSAEKLRAEVAASKGVPADLIRLVAGATREEIEAAADALLQFRGNTPSPLGGNQRPAGPVAQVRETAETREDRRKRLADSLKR